MDRRESDRQIINHLTNFTSFTLHKEAEGQFQNIFYRNQKQLSNMIVCQPLQTFLPQVLSIWIGM